jgi:hypothetical protein
VLGWHNQRGQAENFNKELKNGLGLEQMPCGDSGANAVFFRIGVLAYNLFIGFKRLACPAAWASRTMATVRWKLVQVAGRILRHAWRVVLRLVLDAEALACWRAIRQRCWALCLRSLSCRERGSRGPHQQGWRQPTHGERSARSPTRGVQPSAQRSVEFLSLFLGG